jgi:hypothetical protein
MKGHKKHSHHPHDKIAAMPQFNEGHWEEDIKDVEMSDSKYSSEMNQEEEYRKSVDEMASYMKKHRMKF